MKNIKDNVYDVVEDFYAHDEGWNALLRQEYAEGFLRQEAWKGKKNSELYQIWDHLTILCLYLGSAETFLGDMNADDFIDCVAWCGRNISEFTPDYQNTKAFLESCDGLFKYLKSKNAVSNDTAPQAAAALLLQHDKMNIILPDGQFDDKNIGRAWDATPNVPAKIFLNIGERLQELLEVLHRFFEREYFRLDLDRAAFLYYGILMGYDTDKKEDIEETSECFWDYFLFDYHLLRSDKRPLEFFYERTCLPDGSDYNEAFAKRNSDVLEELCKARLAVFKIDSVTEDGAFYCTDWLTGEKYTLSLPLEENIDLNDAILLGHIFYNESMIMNYVSCLKIGKVAQKRLLNTLKDCKEWYGIQDPTSGWEGFIERNPMVLRHMVFLYSAFVNLNSFSYETAHRNYMPAEIDYHDKVVLRIRQMMEPYHFSEQDIKLVIRLWADFKARTSREIRMPDIWAAGAIYDFIKANGVYNYDDKKIAELCRNAPVDVMRRVAKEIWATLGMEEHDPRYINEEGLLLMALS